jgi:hypothetical protein
MARRWHASSLPSREDVGAMLETESASGAAAGGAHSAQTLLPGDGYDAGVKKPVAVPKK